MNVQNHNEVSRKYYQKLREKYGTTKKHRILMGNPEGLFIDHINGDPKDNRRDNLRVATNQQNSFNRRASSKNTSGYKGVTWSKLHNKWIAQIMLNGKHIHLGLFDNKEKAALAYNKAAIELFGEFAKPNTIGGVLYG